mgnify:CR=1 FL=1
MAKDFNHPKVVEKYDEHIRCLIPGYELVHLQIQSFLKVKLSPHAKILIAGCGTGYELEYLLKTFPEANFVAFDPSEEMIRNSQRRFEHKKDSSRVKFIVGDTSSLTAYENQFDVALAILVSHFLEAAEKKRYFKEIFNSLNDQGILISYDLMKFQNSAQVQQLQHLTLSLGLSEKQSQMMVERLEDDFELISIQDMQQLLRNCGFSSTECFTQISNFYGVMAYGKGI